MERPFRPRRRGVEVQLGPDERNLLVQLLAQLDTMLGDEEGGEDARPGDPLAAAFGAETLAELEALDPDGPVSEPDDPAIARLLPSASRDDPQVAGEFRRMTEHGLRSRKRSGARLAAEALMRPHPVLDPEEAQTLLRALTDLRLVLGERLQLRTDQDADELHERLMLGYGDEVWMATAVTYDTLTLWQEALVGAITNR